MLKGAGMAGSQFNAEAILIADGAKRYPSQLSLAAMKPRRDGVLRRVAWVYLKPGLSGRQAPGAENASAGFLGAAWGIAPLLVPDPQIARGLGGFTETL